MVAILVPYLMGLMCTLALGAPFSTSPSFTLTSLSQNNATIPGSFPPPSSSNNLPPSPYYYTAKASPTSKPILIKFYSYGQTLPKSPVRTVLNTALRDVNAQLHPQAIITDSELHYSSENVNLMIYQGGQMTWDVLESTIGGLYHFVRTYECVGFDFDLVGSVDKKQYGTGVLKTLG